jgi:hypothetical protein
MALPVSITLTIIISHFFFVQKKKLSFLQNSIVFMVISIMTKNYMTIMTMQLKMLKNTEDHFLFLFFLLQREIIIPLLVLIFINTYLLSSCWKRKTFLFIGVLASMQAVEYLSVHFKVVEYVKWNFIFAVIVNVAYLLMGLGLAKIVLFLKQWENRQHDRSL